MPKDTLTFTLRIHDPAEKKDAAKSTSWVVIEVQREDLKISQAAFIEKYVAPNLQKLVLLHLT